MRWRCPRSAPHRLTQPAFEARVGDAVAVPTVGPAVALVEEAVAPGRVALVGGPATRPSEGEGREGAPAVGPALAVAVSAHEEKGSESPAKPLPPSPSPEVPPAATPAPALATVPATPPSTSPEAKAPGGPVSAGTPGFPGEVEEEPGEAGEPGAEEPCTGDEYRLTITPLDETGETVTILLEHVAADGGVETLELEGDLEDARSLVLELSSEGGCVEVEVSPSPGEVEEPTSPPPAGP